MSESSDGTNPPPDGTIPPPRMMGRQAGNPSARPPLPSSGTGNSHPPVAGELAAADAAMPRPTGEDELVAPSRGQERKRQANSAPIVPAGSVTGRSLTLVISIMCFLACLTAGAVYMINQSAAAWMHNIASEVTVQIEVIEEQDVEKRVTEVAFFLARQAGIASVRPLTSAQSAELLEPWLGKGAGLEALPVPRLIALQLDRKAPPPLEQLAIQLSERFPGATLDDHRQWQTQIRTVTRSLALGGLAILVLVGAATTAIIVSATKSSMASNREIIEVLHFVGATDRFIAREFEKHFLTLGIRAGIVGAVSAMAVFFIMPSVVRVLGGGAVTMAEIGRLVGSGSLDIPGYFLLGIVVVVIAALCMLTSRYGVFRILNMRD